MIPFKLNGKPYQCAESFAELSFSQYLALLPPTDFRARLAICAQVPIEETMGKITNMEKLIGVLKFVDKTPAVDATPVSVGEYILPKDITFETVEQFENVRDEINRIATLDFTVQTKALAFYTAVYLKGIDEVYDFDKAKELSERLLAYPCLEVLAAGSFFQAKCLSMQSGLSMNYLRRNILLKKTLPGLNRLLRRLAFMLPWTKWRDMWGFRIRKSSAGQSVSSIQS